MLGLGIGLTKQAVGEEAAPALLPLMDIDMSFANLNQVSGAPVSDGAFIDDVTSIEGNAWVFSQSTPASRPTISSTDNINGFPTITSPGGLQQEFLTRAPIFADNSEGTLIVVFKYDETTSNFMIYQDDETANQYLYLWAYAVGKNIDRAVWAGFNTNIDAVENVLTHETTGLIDGQTYLLVYRNNGSNISCRINGINESTLRRSGTSINWWFDYLDSPTRLSLFPGKYTRMIYYNQFIDNTEIASIETTLNGIYNVY